MRKRVLVLEDDVVLARTAIRILKGYFEVEVFPTVEAAFEALLQRPFDVIVSDVNIVGGMPGTDLYRKVEKTFPEMVSKFMFYTASIDPYNLRTFKVPVLMKPASPQDLIDKIRSLCDDPTSG
jgi:DNA-binding NtrC family response regulator